MMRYVGVSSPQPGGHPQPDVCISSPQRGGTPKPRVRAPRPVGRGAEPWGGDDSASATPTGLNKMRSPTKHGPIRPRVETGDVRGVTCVRMGPRRSCRTPLGCLLDAARIPQGSAPRLAAGGRTLGFGVPPRCGEERRTAGRASIANSLIRSFFDGWRTPFAIPLIEAACESTPGQSVDCTTPHGGTNDGRSDGV